jgi:hypothetical protein
MCAKHQRGIVGSFATRFQGWLIKIKCLTPWENLECCFKNVLRTFSSSCFILTKNKLQRKSTYFFKSTMYKTKKHFSLESTHRFTTISMSIKARNLWVKVGLSSLAYAKDQACAHGFNSKTKIKSCLFCVRQICHNPIRSVQHFWN